MFRRTLLTLLALAMTLALAAGAEAETKERVGTRINLFAGGFQVFPAGQPFHISHGWGLSPHDPARPLALGKYGFSLAVDGIQQQEDYVEKLHFVHPVFGELQGRTWIHNFPEGMTGTHTFTGHWFGPCEGLVAGGFTPVPCEHPNEITTSVAPLTITVVFTP